MKTHLMFAAGVALLSTNAFATKARMMALGQDSERGSHYIQDGRNKFRNAAAVNALNNYTVMEWGGAGQAEGGFFKPAGGFVYGLYLGSDHRQAAYQTFDSTTGEWSNAPQYTPGNQLDLFFGGGDELQWGARLNYMNGNNAISSETRSAYGLGLGIVMGDMNAYANIDIADKIEDNSTEGAAIVSKGKIGFDVGAAYKMDNLTFYADYASNGTDITVAGAAAGSGKLASILVGAAHTVEISPTSMFALAGHFSNNKVTYGEGTATADRTANALTATLSFEANATSWLTWRGSVAQNIIIGTSVTDGTADFVATDIKGKKVTTDNSTTTAAGAGLNFGQLTVDGSIGTVTAGSIRLDEVFTNVAVSYKF